jgi:hypothetical protein
VIAYAFVLATVYVGVSVVRLILNVLDWRRSTYVADLKAAVVRYQKVADEARDAYQTAMDQAAMRELDRKVDGG